jgi:glutathione S-transferase
MTIQVYCDPCTVNSRKVMVGLEQLKADYKYNHIDYFTGEHKSDDFKKINPMGTVPAAVDGDLTLTESNAILQYAADLASDDSMYPKDLKQRANINRWLFWEASSWFHSCYVYLVENCVKPGLFKVEPDQKVLDGESERFHKCAGMLDAQLGTTKWLTGDKVTIADIAVAAPMHLYVASKLPLDDYSNLKRWMSESVEQLDSWKKTQAPVDKMMASGSPSNSSVRTTVNYTRAVDGITEVYFYESKKAKDAHEPGDAPVDILVHDGRVHSAPFTLDENRFSIHPFQSSHKDWEDDEAVRSCFYPEVVEFLKGELGAKRVLVFDHTIRSEANAKKKLTDEKNTSQRSPVMLVHCDYTCESGPLRVRQLLPTEADDLLSRRVCFINVWKPINRIVEERPLAMCDSQSTEPDDFFKLFLRYRDRTGENYVMKHNERHKWWHFSRMTPEEVVLLKTFDSETDGRARFAGHTAFVDPNSADDAPLRESVEIRTICFY